MSATPVTFYLKYFESITTSMLNWMTGAQQFLTDFNVGSVNRTMIEALSMELEVLYERIHNAIEDSIPLSIFTAFDFPKQGATKATGVVTFGRSTNAPQNYVIPQGLVIATADGVEFETLAQVTLLQGTQSIAANVRAMASGAAGNVLGGTIVKFKASVAGIETVTNATALIGGADEETDDARKARFADFVSNLARSPQLGIIAGAKSTVLKDVNGAIIEQVTRAKIVEPYLTDTQQKLGELQVYIDNGLGTASSNLINQAQIILDGYTDGNGNPVIGYKAAGVVVTVLAVTAQTVNVAATITPIPGYTVNGISQALSDAATGYFNGLDIGEDLDWDRLHFALMAVKGVRTITLTQPAADTPATSGVHRIRPGTLTWS